jgi:tetratricopeptide (TPR) repeat protein
MAKKKSRKSGPARQQARARAVRGAGAGGDYIDMRHGAFTGSGGVVGKVETLHVYAHAPVPTALDALPAVPAGFTGRADTLADVLDALDPTPGSGPGRAAAVVVAGLAGVGKTSLALVAAHTAWTRGTPPDVPAGAPTTDTNAGSGSSVGTGSRAWFDDVLFVDLRGYDEHPNTPEQALDALLRALGTDPQHIPPGVDERAAWYRSALADLDRQGRAVLILADNASGANQVRPLLPGGGRHRLLVTSRHTLPTLGARLIDIGVLPPAEAVETIRVALTLIDPGDRRVEENPGDVAALARLCGYLPLALQITAALLAQDPQQPLGERASQLTEAWSRLGHLDDGDRAVRASLDLSYRHLTHQECELLALLGLNPGPEFCLAAAAVLLDRPAADVRLLLEGLTRAHLLERTPDRDRRRMHDLVHHYATEQARTRTDPDAPRNTRRRYTHARTRLIDNYYLRHTRAAFHHLQPSPGGAAPSPVFGDRTSALVWLDTERGNLVTAVHTGIPDDDTNAARLALGLGPYLTLRRYFDDLAAVSTLARDLCQRLGDRHGEAAAWNNLGTALREMRRFDEAITAHTRARDTLAELGDRHREAMAWNNLGAALREMRRFDEAITAHTRARDTLHELRDRHGEAGAWNNLGRVLAEVGRVEEAVTAWGEGLAAYRETGDHHRAGRIGEELAAACTDAGDTTRARKARAGAAADYTTAGATDDASRVRAQDE